MKIYILRHEDRLQDCSFFAPLTKHGLENAAKLVNILKEHDINVIYSSPFIRTLQTIYPYSKESGIKINLEYGLSEIHHSDIIPKKAVGLHLPEYIAKSFNYNDTYKTIVAPEQIIYPEEDIKPVRIRMKKVLKDIITKYAGKNINIIIVSHQSICADILKIIYISMKKQNLNIPHELKDAIDNYKTGELCLFYNNGWKFQKIN
jgi:broad specificity phosphatase PhoE